MTTTRDRMIRDAERRARVLDELNRAAADAAHEEPAVLATRDAATGKVTTRTLTAAELARLDPTRS